MPEINDVHPRVAHWLASSGWVYLYEYQRMDFLAINSVTGEIRIIECKFKVGVVSYIVNQINRYYDALGLPGAQRLCMAFGTLNLVQKAEFALNNVTPVMLTESHPAASITRHRYTMPAFDGVFKKFYGGKSFAQHRLDYSQIPNKSVTRTLELTDSEIERLRAEDERLWSEYKRRIS